MPTITLYDLGSKGVNVDKDEVHSDPTEYSSAQNVIRDPLGVSEGITNRPGLVKFNSVASAGSLLGGIGVPLPFNPTLTHTFYWARDSGGGSSLGWRTSTNEWTTGASISSGTPANPQAYGKCASFYTAASSLFTGITGCIFENKLVYAGDNYFSASTNPPLRLFDGTNDYELCKIPSNPDNPSAVPPRGVVTMLPANGTVYLTTLDGGSSDANWRGGVWDLDISTRVLTRIGPTTPVGEIPYSLAYAYGKLWLGTTHITPSTGQGKVYWIRPGIDASWTLDDTLAVNYYGVTCLLAYRGELYAGVVAFTGTSGVVRKRTTLGVWSTEETGWGTAANNGYFSLIEFGGNLYTGYYNANATSNFRIRKFDSASWSTALTSTNQNNYSTAYVHNTKLYMAASFGTGGGGAEDLLITSNGSSWTDLSAAIVNNNTGIFGAITT